MDILAAIESAPTRGPRRCVIQKWLDTIPEDAPGLDKLVAHLTQPDSEHVDYKTRIDLMGVLSRLGFHTSENSIGDHRRQACACFR